MINSTFNKILAGLKSDQIIPCIGVNALKGSVHKENGNPIPADSNSLIIAMNGGQPMPPKLMYEFSRAAMNLELKKGRDYVTKFLTDCYGKDVWTRPPVYDWLTEIKPKYLIDINRDIHLQTNYADSPHNLIVGISRIKAVANRFKIFNYDGNNYNEIEQEAMDLSLPSIFKPMGSPLPEPYYVASDADYVDYLTELRGGFGVPKCLKEYRKGRQYLFIGMRFTRDTERMILADFIYDAAEPIKGWILLPEPTRKEERFCERMGIEIIKADIDDLLNADMWSATKQMISA
jgi:hypothetical protein